MERAVTALRLNLVMLLSMAIKTNRISHGKALPIKIRRKCPDCLSWLSKSSSKRPITTRTTSEIVGRVIIGYIWGY